MEEYMQNYRKIIKYSFSFLKPDFKEAEKWSFKSKTWKPKISPFVIKKP